MIAYFSILILKLKLKKDIYVYASCLGSEIEMLHWQGRKQEECCFQKKEISA